MLLLERLNEVVSDSLVEVFTSKVCVSRCCEHLKDSIVDSQDGNIESSTAEVENNDILLFLLIKPIGNGSCGRLINDSEDIKASDCSSVFGGLSLRVVEVSRHSDHCILDIFPKVVLGDVLHLGEYHT